MEMKVVRGNGVVDRVKWITFYLNVNSPSLQR